jgi:hypothetical protein
MRHLRSDKEHDEREEDFSIHGIISFVSLVTHQQAACPGDSLGLSARPNIHYLQSFALACLFIRYVSRDILLISAICFHIAEVAIPSFAPSFLIVCLLQ